MTPHAESGSRAVARGKSVHEPRNCNKRRTKKRRFCFQFPLSSFDNDGETMKFAAAATWQKQINNSMRRHLQTVSKTAVVNKQMTERGKNSLLLITCFPCNCDLIGPPCCVFTLRHTGLHCGVCLQAIHSWHPDNLLRYAHTFISPKTQTQSVCFKVCCAADLRLRILAKQHLFWM